MRLRYAKNEAFFTGKWVLEIEQVSDGFRVSAGGRSIITRYPRPLIEALAEAKGESVCDEIEREEQPGYLRRNIRWGVEAHLDPSQMAGARILDFGCGCGASTTILARLYPDARIIGVELLDASVRAARARAAHFDLGNVEFHVSPSPNSLPPLGSFDVIIFSALYEHLMPGERKTLVPAIWRHLKPDGTLLIYETPHRWFPIETHTSLLPLVNYLPPQLALAAVRVFSPRQSIRDRDWPSLLRSGIRGGSSAEILAILRAADDGLPVIVEPSRLGVRNRVEQWCAKAAETGISTKKRFFLSLIKAAHRVGIQLLPEVMLAVNKR